MIFHSKLCDKKEHNLSGISLIPDRPRFCRLLKTRNRRHPQLSGMVGDKSGKLGVFLFSQNVSQISAMIGDFLNISAKPGTGWKQQNLHSSRIFPPYKNQAYFAENYAKRLFLPY